MVEYPIKFECNTRESKIRKFERKTNTRTILPTNKTSEERTKEGGRGIESHFRLGRKGATGLGQTLPTANVRYRYSKKTDFSVFPQ